MDYSLFLLQTHVIKPLMSRLDNLIKATIKNKHGISQFHKGFIWYISFSTKIIFFIKIIYLVLSCSSSMSFN